jgi:5-methylcytosine-specific restriction endonuclease McrA
MDRCKNGNSIDKWRILHRYRENGKIFKTKNINDAREFYSCNTAMRKVFKAPSQCRGYYCFDTEDISYNPDKPKRRSFKREERKYIYDKADGYCQLCGKKLKFEDATMDHIVPLSMGGVDDLSNLQLACEPCNKFKDNILPAEFLQRISETFFYQMGKAHGNSLKWRLLRNVLEKMI